MRSFQFDIRPSQTTLAALMTAALTNSNPIVAGLAIGTALWNTIRFEVNLTPRREVPDEFAQAMTFAFEAKSHFQAPKFTRFPDPKTT